MEMESEQRMCAIELGLNPDSSKWTKEDREKFYHWSSIFHARDVESGPDYDNEIRTRREEKEREAINFFKQSRR